MNGNAKSKSTFYGIQALRAIAALAVVMEHCIYLWLGRVVRTPDADFWMNGAAGVDVFFVISGFVMATSLPGFARYRHPAREFLKRRITRIVPLYWLATTLKVILLLALPGLALHSAVRLSNVIGSYLFVSLPNADNVVVPIIVVGWTLNFEMFFYLVFAMAMLFGGRVLPVLIGALTLLAAIGPFRHPSWPFIAQFADPMLAEFIFGIVIARLAIRGWLLSRISSIFLLVAGFVAIMAIYPHLPYDLVRLKWRFLLWGLPAAAIVLGAVGLERFFAASIPRWLVSLGDASYAIYLVQTFILPLVGITLVKLGLKGGPALVFAILLGLILSALAGALVHRYIEIPILAGLKSKQTAGVQSLPA